ncbi:MAG: tRNA uridine-5-carboxymethylaminomethyl(34) synthesis GTPase MnmE [Oscillospiraceae bacterium]|nr:tRNA uridine-5-carboxymethylaminomethyl(34) synthesis GTPase MnmE [Oscillospiraceae bacterium]
MNDTIAAVSTALARSGVAVIRISGAEAATIAKRMFAKPLVPRKAVYGDLLSESGVLLDNIVALYFPAPNSYTGEEVVEFHCHGSPALVVVVLKAAFALGARQALAGEFTKRAFLNGKLDLIQAEAVADLIDAETEQAAVNAASQLSGAISKQITRVYDDLTGLMAHFYAAVDYPEEDIEPQNDILDVARNSIDALTKLEATFEKGRIVKDGLSVVILGKPNVGKSSLLNALVGFDRAIVTATPGTTRDTIEDSTVINGLRLRLTDTAGIRESSDAIERLGIERSEDSVAYADVIVVALDASAPLDAEDDAVIELAERSGKPVFTVLNKSDLPRVCLAEGIPVSAKTGDGIVEFGKALTSRFATADTAVQTALLSNERQHSLVVNAISTLKLLLENLQTAGVSAETLSDAEFALNCLAEAIGRKVQDDIVETIFSRFCVGK